MEKSSGAVHVSGKGLKIGIVVSRFNKDITEKLLEGAEKALKDCGVRSTDVKIVWVPGAFEIPILLQTFSRRKRFDALIALGAVIRGETPHFDYVCDGVASGTMRVALDAGIPIAFGVLTTDTMQQALDRVGGRHGHKGEEAAMVAVEMARLVKSGK